MSVSYSDMPCLNVFELALHACQSNDVSTLATICNDHVELLKTHHETLCNKAFTDIHLCKDIILFLFKNPGSEEHKLKTQQAMLLNYCMVPLKNHCNEMTEQETTKEPSNISQFYNKIYYQSYLDLFFKFIELNHSLAALPEVHEIAFLSKPILNYLMTYHLKSFLTSKTLFLMIQKGESLDNMIDTARGIKHFAVDEYTQNGVNSLILALEQGRLRLAEQLIALGAKLEKVFEFVLQQHPSSETVFLHALKIASFTKKIKMSRLLEQNDYPKICLALVHGASYDDQEIAQYGDPRLKKLLKKFKKAKNAVSAMQLSLQQKPTVHFIKSVFNNRSFYRKCLLLSRPENRLLEQLTQQPDQVELLIQKEIKENIFNGIPESYYLQELLYIQLQLPILKKVNTPRLAINKKYYSFKNQVIP